MNITVLLPQPFATPTGQATHIDIDEYGCAPRGRWFRMHYFLGTVVEREEEVDGAVVTYDVFVRDEDFPNGLTANIEADEFERFLEWAVSEDGVGYSDEYGALFNIRTAARWIGWRQFQRRLTPAQFAAKREALIDFLGTNPPEDQ